MQKIKFLFFLLINLNNENLFLKSIYIYIKLITNKTPPTTKTIITWLVGSERKREPGRKVYDFV